MGGAKQPPLTMINTVTYGFFVILQRIKPFSLYPGHVQHVRVR